MAVRVQKFVAHLDPDLPVSNVMTLREAIVKSTIEPKVESILVLAFAIIAPPRGFRRASVSGGPTDS
jgi:putative ABC transport system permease protein